MKPLDLKLDRMQPNPSTNSMDGAEVVDKLAKDWTQPQQLERPDSVGLMTKFLNLFAQRSPSSLPKDRMIKIDSEKLRKRMGELYLQTQISKTSETFSRPHRREALWMPVHALLCRDRFVFACSGDPGGTQPEFVLEDVMFHHIESICNADILEERGEWKVRPTANPLQSKLWGVRNLVFGFGSNRVQEATGDFVVETPMHSRIGPDGEASGADSGGRFLRLRLSCRSE
jgi:hypothetical protein